MTTTRQRRRPKKQQDEPPADPLDSDDQEHLVKEFAKEMEHQQELIASAFGSASVPLSCPSCAPRGCICAKDDDQSTTGGRKLLQWTHTLLAASLHGSAAYAVSALPTHHWKWSFLYLPFALMLLVGTSALFAIRKQQGLSSNEAVWLHQGMLLANVLTAGAGLYLRWDALSIEKSLQELKTSQCRYKQPVD